MVYHEQVPSATKGDIITISETAKLKAALKIATNALKTLALNSTDECSVYTMGCDCGELAVETLARMETKGKNIDKFFEESTREPPLPVSDGKYRYTALVSGNYKIDGVLMHLEEGETYEWIKK